jgi:hypothetical protein
MVVLPPVSWCYDDLEEDRVLMRNESKYVLSCEEYSCGRR